MLTTSVLVPAPETMGRIGPMVLALSLLVGGADAQPRDVERADALFREARKLMASRDFQTACPKLEESYRLDPAAGTAVNLGDCFDRVGKVGSALLAYQAAKRLLAPSDPRNAPVAKQIAVLKRRVSRVIITLAPDAPEGVTVLRDGRPVDVADFGKALPVNSGKHTIEVQAPGRKTVRRTVKLAEGDSWQFLASAGTPVGSDGTEDGPGADRDGQARKTTGLVIAGVGVAGLTTGIVTGLMANAKQDVVDDNCDASKRCNETGYDAAQSGKTLTTVSFIGWGVGLVGLAAGGYFLFVADGSKPTTTVGASAGTRGGQVTLGRTFW